jgi:hypothetical protein
MMADEDYETALDLSVKTTTTTTTKRSKDDQNSTNGSYLNEQPPNKRKKTQPKPCKNFDIDDEYYSEDEETTSVTTIESIRNEHQQEQEQQQQQQQNYKEDSDEIFPPHSEDLIPQQQQQLINNTTTTTGSTATTGKKQMRFQCKFCTYRSHSVSLMQNHIYRHIDTTPYSCFYCGHKSTTKSTIMVHIELCHPNMDVKIKENRVKEEDYYLDLNSNGTTTNGGTLNGINGNKNNNRKSSSISSTPTVNTNINRFIDTCENKFQIIPSKCQTKDEKLFNEVNNNDDLNINSSPTTASSSSCCVSPAISPNVQINEQQNDQTTNNNNNNDESKIKQVFFISLYIYFYISIDDKYLTIFNRPKQFFGSLYEPDKQYSCKLCTYTTNHKPSMEDHVYVHTNKRPYKYVSYFTFHLFIHSV